MKISKDVWKRMMISIYESKKSKDLFDINLETYTKYSNYVPVIGNIDISGNVDIEDGYEFEYAYIDEENNRIESFMSISFDELKSFIEHNIAPYVAHNIGIFKDNTLIGIINISSFKPEYAERKYRVGLFSDIHYNDYTIDSENGTWDDDGSQYRDDLINALSIYQDKEEVKFMCVSGDISTDSIKHILNFKQMKNEYAPDTPLYACLGNHDFCATSSQDEIGNQYNEIGLNVEDMTRLQAWNLLIVPENSEFEIHFQDSSTEYGKTSYWFEVPIEGTKKSDIFLFLSVNYGYDNYTTIANKKLSIDDQGTQELVDYVGYMPSKYNLQFYDNTTLLWLKGILESNTEKRIFIFTHQFFSHKAGNNNSNNLYGYAADGWRITEDSAYCLCGIQFEFLNKLNNEFKNTIWITGHSHYKWDWQIIDPYISICDNEYNIERPDDETFNEERRYLRKSNEPIGKSGFNVHLPSTVRPLKFSEGYDVAGGDSEGAIIDIYEDYVDIRGIVFKENYGEYTNKYFPLSQYRINIKAN